MKKRGMVKFLIGKTGRKTGEMTLPMSLVLDKELTCKTVFWY